MSGILVNILTFEVFGLFWLRGGVFRYDNLSYDGKTAGGLTKDD